MGVGVGGEPGSSKESVAHQDRQRKVKDRALQLLLANLKISPLAYQAVVKRQN